MIIITDAKPDHLDAIYEVERSSFERPYPRGLLKFYLLLTPRTFLIAKDSRSGRIVGYAVGLLQWGIVGHVISIAVLEEYRRKGIGRALMKELETRLSGMGALYFVLETSLEWGTVVFYNKLGYRVARFLRSYYGRGDHGVLMVKPAKYYSPDFE